MDFNASLQELGRRVGTANTMITNPDDSSSCPQTLAVANARARARQFARFIPLQAALAAFCVSAGIVMVALSNSRLKKQLAFHVCIASIVFEIIYVSLDASISGSFLRMDFCIFTFNAQKVLATRAFRTFIPWLADFVLPLRILVFYPLRLTSPSRFSLIMGPAIVLKMLRLGIIIWCLLTWVPYFDVPKQMWAEYVVQLVDNFYCATVVYLRLRRIASGPMRGAYHASTLLQRINRLIRTTLSLFIVPLGMNLILVVSGPYARHEMQGEPWNTAQQYAYRLNNGLSVLNIVLSTILVSPSDSGKAEMLHGRQDGSSGDHRSTEGRRSSYISPPDVRECGCGGDISGQTLGIPLKKEDGDLPVFLRRKTEEAVEKDDQGANQVRIADQACCDGSHGNVDRHGTNDESSSMSSRVGSVRFPGTSREMILHPRRGGENVSSAAQIFPGHQDPSRPSHPGDVEAGNATRPSLDSLNDHSGRRYKQDEENVIEDAVNATTREGPRIDVHVITCRETSFSTRSSSNSCDRPHDTEAFQS
ncbi:hypothetical protein IE53DRAFT_34422 [Violaceomyces palustris]|uniref:Uncharacterized protein n=1 Tax=Violaceomyces palustris TaxID=1673888 RepID=A0ACD0P1A3_9BASI|nr:hypothetical protein IE53DRAFT_34422 [Violaceomyces palustris]